MILSKLNRDERTEVKSFFLTRVLPLALLFSIFLFYSNGLLIAAALFICIPLEVYIIIVILELNVSGKYFTTLKINLLGYPLIFVIYIIASNFFYLQQFQILLIFIGSSFLRLLTALNYRNSKTVRRDVLLVSPKVPLQQAGNYMLFKVDQVIIASALLQMPFFRLPLPGDYLFYSKFSEIFSGIATSLGPVLAKSKKNNSPEISVKPLLKNKIFIKLNVAAVLVRVIFSLLLLKTLDSLHLLMLIPFTLATLLIIPVNMINYELYRKNSLQHSNKYNFICLLSSTVLLLASCIFKSAFLFAWIVPFQLSLFIVLYYTGRKKEIAAQ